MVTRRVALSRYYLVLSSIGLLVDMEISSSRRGFF